MQVMTKKEEMNSLLMFTFIELTSKDVQSDYLGDIK